ncbi:hypothetical protein PEX1_094440 [Penicillium expansum]|nr:hypothetical protein PEXP_060880 [Penicillium expansum]KGO59619.1 hypothetical protein PEX1_094440 [Penicillium expansum]
MSLLSLPLEIQLEVLSYCSIDDISFLSISCRTLQTVCDLENREKFHEIIIHCDDESRNAAFDLLMAILKQPYLGHYVRHIECRDPISILEIYPQRDHQRELGDNDLSLLRDAVGNAGFTGSKQDQVLNMLMQQTAANTIRKEGEKEEQYDDKYDDDEREAREWKARGSFTSQALTALLITVSPNLMYLATIDPKGGRYDLPTEWPLHELLYQTNSDAKNKPFLRNLRKVHIIREGDHKWDNQRLNNLVVNDLISDTTCFIRCFRLFDTFLSIECIRTEGMFEIWDMWPTISEQSAIVTRSNVSKFSLPSSSVSSTNLAVMISACKVLREFQYSHGGRSNQRGHISFNIKTFIKAICPHKNTLEVLNLDVDYACNSSLCLLEEGRLSLDVTPGGPLEPLDPDGFEPTLTFLQSIWKNSGSLKDFVALKRLGMGIQTLLYFAKGVHEGIGEKNGKAVLAECLPDNLSFLCIHGYERGKNSEWDTQIDALKAFHASGSSNLIEISGIDEQIPNSP